MAATGTTNTAAEGRAWMTYRTAAVYTGLGRTTLTDLVYSGRVEAIKHGRRVLISRESLDRYLESLDRVAG